MIKIKPRLRVMLIVAFVTVCLYAVSGCSPGTSVSDPTRKPEAAEPKTGGTITMAYPLEPDTLDPHKSLGSDSIVSDNIGGTLVSVDPATREIKPYLAEDYKVSGDGKTYTFTIRQGITMHDGTPLTAKTFKETFERMLDPQTKSSDGPIYLEGLKSVKTPDDHTLVMEFAEPRASFLQAIATSTTQPLSMKAIEKYGNDYGRHPVGVGPWKFDSWQAGQSVTLVRNENFRWGESLFENHGPPRADKLVIKFISEPQISLSALENGSIDIVPQVPTKFIKNYRNNPKYQVLEEETAGLGLFLEMNLRNQLFQDIQVRKAFNMLVNKEVIIQAALHGEGQVAQGLLSQNMLGYDKAVEAYGYQYNLEEAKKLLDEAGWKVNGTGIREKDGKTLTLSLVSSAQFEMQAQLIQSMLKEAGIKVSIQNLDLPAQVETAMKGDFDLTFGAYGAFDPDILFMCFHSSQIGANNWASVKDDRLDDLLVQGRVTTDREARKKIYVEVQKRILEQAYIVPIYISKQFTIVNSRVKGVKVGNDRVMLNDAWVDE